MEVVRVLQKGLSRFLNWIFRAIQVRTRRFFMKHFGRTPSLRLRVARIIDLFMARAFLQNFLISLSAAMSLVCLFTFFEIIDSVFQNKIPYSLVAEYFLFLQPHFFMLLVPISVLIGTLVTFGSMEKFNQIVAFKSCGVSVYRIAAPVFVFAALISTSIFALQEYVLPYANQRQDNLRNVIKGRPAQTTRPGRRWVFGSDGRLYSYSLFSSKWDLFLDLTVYQMDLSESRLSEIIYGERVEWDREAQDWIFHGGWQRSLDTPAFSRFDVPEDGVVQEDLIPSRQHHHGLIGGPVRLDHGAKRGSLWNCRRSAVGNRLLGSFRGVRRPGSQRITGPGPRRLGAQHRLRCRCHHPADRNPDLIS